MFAFLGRFNISDENEQNWVKKEISKIIVHPDYKHGDLDHQKSDTDIAILFMETPVLFTNYIQPICLLSRSRNIEDDENYVVGYANSATPYKYELFADNLLQCYSNNSIALKSFCENYSIGVLCNGKLEVL